jgi:nitrite reductase/ring-hydroxylating ferredoxin subunit
LTVRSDHCEDCVLSERRAFLREVTAWLAAAALAPLPIRFGRATLIRGSDLTYPIPAADGATIDHDNQVILVRFQGKAYAFNLSCPHQNTALRWHPEDGQFQCPKHHSRYTPDGVFISGRATRSMDRFAVRRDGANILVDLDRLFRQDQDAADWNTAFVTT